MTLSASAEFLKIVVPEYNGRLERGSNTSVTRARLFVSHCERPCRFAHDSTAVVLGRIEVAPITLKTYLALTTAIGQLPPRVREKGEQTQKHLEINNERLEWYFPLILSSDDVSNREIFEAWFDLANEEISLIAVILAALTGDRELYPDFSDEFCRPALGQA